MYLMYRCIAGRISQPARPEQPAVHPLEVLTVNSQELLLNAITNGLEDDGTTSAALDAIREESGCSLLAAVLEVARVHRAARSARDITEATGYLADGSAIKDHLTKLVEDNCLNLPDDALVTVTVVEGDAPPIGQFNVGDNGIYPYPLASITVGALWVKRAANRIMVEQERADAMRARHVKGNTNGRARRVK